MNLITDGSKFGLALAGGGECFTAASNCLSYLRDPNGYRATIRVELANTPANAPAEDKLFSQHVFIMQWLDISPTLCLRLWDLALSELRAVDDARFRQMHKGTPFYYMAMAAYLAGDFDRFATMLDAAVADDARVVGAGCWNNPAGKWLLFDTNTPTQAAYFENLDAQKLLDEVLQAAAKFEAAAVTRTDLLQKLTVPVFTARPELRGVVAAMLGFLLQHRSMMREARLMEGSVGASGRVFGYLFRGCAVFESLVRLSVAGGSITAANPKATLNDFLKDSNIYQKLGFASQPQGLPNVATFADLVVRARDPLGPSETEQTRSIRVTWSLRNTTGHNLGAPSVVNVSDAERLSLRVVASICHAVASLF